MPMLYDVVHEGLFLGSLRQAAQIDPAARASGLSTVSRQSASQQLQFKKVHRTHPVYSARVNDDCRVLGIVDGDDIVWFWIGKHEEYERLLKVM
jgi:hypothetical protein